ncbi:MAG: class I tRNA ligase family protein, partial [Candidatus Omnitrophica bacterium]|nr:class I tRNA ligase family protein [Candidatus Omnitrophota bacterium]
NPDFIKPSTRYNEVIGFLETSHLADQCISRPIKRVSWGIPFPFDANYVVYVWFDALLNYISGIGFGQEGSRFKTFWPADVHFMAKDILKQHAVFWPIMLKSLEIEPPRVVFAHGWWKLGEEKISKSRGNAVNPVELIEELKLGAGGVDALRYFLLREVPIGADGNFSFSALVNRTNSDLANDLGNLVYRTLNMAEKYFQGEVSGQGLPEEFKEVLNDLNASYKTLMGRGEFSLSLERIFKFINVMNKYIENTKPWVLWKEKKENDVRNFLYALLEGIRIVSLYLSPFIPFSSGSIYRQIGIEESVFDMSHATWGFKKSFVIKRQAPLFPRIEIK